MKHTKHPYDVNYDVICQKPLLEDKLYEAWDLVNQKPVRLRYTMTIDESHNLVVALHLFKNINNCTDEVSTSYNLDDVYDDMNEIITVFPNVYFLIDHIKSFYQVWNNRLDT